MPRASYITDEIATVLYAAEVEGDALRLTGQLDRKLYAKVNAVLETMGGVWNRKAKAHLFPTCPAGVIAAAMGEENGEAAPVELLSERIKRLQFYQTPEPLARRMAGWAVPERGRVLEPSAGHGRLVEAALEFGPASVAAVEIDEQNVDVVSGAFPLGDGPPVWTTCADFLDLSEAWLADPGFQGFDAILMNPPFTRNQDIRHVVAASRLLRPDGRLAAVVSNHFTFGEDRESKWFRERLEARGAEIYGLPPDTFKAEGVGVSASLVFLERNDA